MLLEIIGHGFEGFGILSMPFAPRFHNLLGEGFRHINAPILELGLGLLGIPIQPTNNTLDILHLLSFHLRMPVLGYLIVKRT